MQNKAAAYLNSFIILANVTGFFVNGMRKILTIELNHTMDSMI